MNRVRKAFTLVEILIVVIILGILAAIVVPQFTSASQEAQLSNAESQLQTIRNMIELYRVRNNGDYPPLAVGDDPQVCWAPLIGEDYLRNPPINPRTGKGTIAAGTAAAISDTVGWFWDEDTGTIRAACLEEVGIDADIEETAWMEAE